MVAVANTASASGGTLWAATETVSYDLQTASGNDRVLILLVHWEGPGIGERPTSATYDDVAMTKVYDSYIDTTFDAGVVAFAIFEDDIPASTGTYDFVVTFLSAGSSGTEYCVGVFEVTGASQSTISNVEISESASAATTTTLTVTPAGADSLIIAGGVTGNANNFNYPGGFTKSYEVDESSSTGSGGYIVNSGSSDYDVVITWGGSANRHAAIAFEIQTASSDQDITENVTATETSVIDLTKDFSESVTSTESNSIDYGLSVSETATATETDVYDFVKEFDESVTATETDDESVSGGATAIARLNCGGPEYVDGSSNTWDANEGAVSGTSLFSTADAIADTTEDTLFQTERGISASGSSFFYDFTFTVPDATDLTVRLYFAEIFFTSSGQRLFDILIDGVQKETELDIYNEVGHDTALIREYSVTSTSTTLTVRIKNGSANKAKINAIEILTTSGSSGSQERTYNESVTATETADINAGEIHNEPVTATESIQKDYVFEFTESVLVDESDDSAGSGGGGDLTAIYRINCGGSAYTASNGDEWIADQYYQATGTSVYSVADPISGTIDDVIYQSERSSSVQTSGFGVTYTLTVEDATDYFVRLHFAEIFFDIEGARKFNIVIDGVTLETFVDIVELAGESYAAVVRDFSVTSTSTSMAIKVENVGIQKAKINGIEVFTGTAPSNPTQNFDTTVNVTETCVIERSNEYSESTTATESTVKVREVAFTESVQALESSSSPAVTASDGLVVTPTSTTELYTPAGGTAPSPAFVTVTIWNPTDTAIEYHLWKTASWIIIPFSEWMGFVQPGQTKIIQAQIETTGLADDVYLGHVAVCNMERSDDQDWWVPIRLTVGAGEVAPTNTYYIDYDDGDDSANGLTPATAWKNHPWGQNKPGGTVAATTDLVPGDKCVFKGGVHYRDWLYGGDSGTPSSRIILDGNTDGSFGSGQAVIDGSDVLTGWTDIGGGVYRTSYTPVTYVSQGTTKEFRPINYNVYDGERPMLVATGPNFPSDRYLWDDILGGDWREADNMSGATIVDSIFATYPSDFWNNDVYASVWTDGNRVEMYRVTGYNGTDTITVESSFTPNSNGDYYSLSNAPVHFTEEGMFRIDETNNTIDIIPFSDSDLSNITISQRIKGLDQGAANSIEVRGFRIMKHSGRDSGQGCAITHYGSSNGDDWYIHSNEMLYNSSHTRGEGVIDIRNIDDALITDNFIHKNRGSRGIRTINGDNFVVDRNVLFANGGTGIFSNGSPASNVYFLRNAVWRHLGTHGNGISTYAESLGVWIIGNHCDYGNIALTTQTQTAGPTYVAFNFFRSQPGFVGFVFANYSPETSYDIKVWGNTIIGFHTLTVLANGPAPGYEFFYNIVAGGGVSFGTAGTFTSGYNVITDTAPSEPYTPVGTDIVEADLDNIFIDADNGDYRLSSTSVALNIGPGLSGFQALMDSYGHDFQDIIGGLKDAGWWEEGAEASNPNYTETVTATESIAKDYVLEFNESVTATESQIVNNDIIVSFNSIVRVTETSQRETSLVSQSFVRNFDELVSVTELADVNDTVVSQGEVEWTIEGQVQSGNYPDGQAWVVGPCVVTPYGIRPGAEHDSTVTTAAGVAMPGGWYKNGSGLNWANASPSGGVAVVNQNYQPFDSSAYGQFRNSINAYQHSYNVGWGVAQGGTLALAVGDVLVTAKSTDTAGAVQQVDTYGFLHVVSAPPETDEYAPGHIGTTRLYGLRQSLLTVDVSTFPKWTVPGSAPDPDDIIAELSGAWFDGGYTEFLASYLHPGDHMDTYGQANERRTTEAILLLCCDITDAKKQAILDLLIQRGIDYYSKIAEHGFGWQPNGGYSGGRWRLVAILAWATGNASVIAQINAWNNADSSETGQHFRVTQGIIDGAGVDYTQETLGMAEWAFRYYTYTSTPSVPHHAWSPYAGGNNFRRCCTMITAGTAYFGMKALGVNESVPSSTWSILEEYFNRYIEVEERVVALDLAGTGPWTSTGGASSLADARFETQFMEDVYYANRSTVAGMSSTAVPNEEFPVDVTPPPGDVDVYDEDVTATETISIDLAKTFNSVPRATEDIDVDLVPGAGGNGYVRTFTTTVEVSEAFSRDAVYERSFDEDVTSTESTAKGYVAAHSESVTSTESLSKGYGLVRSSSATATESRSSDLGKTFAENVSVTEGVSANLLEFDQTVTATETYLVTITKIDETPVLLRGTPSSISLMGSTA